MTSVSQPASPPAAGAGQARPGMVLLAAAGATFLAFLDVTVVNVAFPALSADFADSSLADLSWVITGYGVLFAALLTPAGRLADVTGRRRLFAMSMVGFIVASILVASSPSLPLLIAARVLQGGAAAGMIPAALGLVLAATPPSRRTVAVGLWAGAGSLAAAAGPSLGGLLIELSNWRAVFLINVPIGLGIVALSYRHIAKDVPSGRRLPDALGTAMVAIGIALVVLGLTQGSDWGWSHPSTLSCLVGGVLLLLLALWKSARHPAPAVEIDLWRRSRTFAAANVGSLLFGMAMFAWLLLGPLYLVLVWDYSILRAGLAISPGACTAAVAAVVVGRRAVGRGQQAAMIVGALLFAGSAGWFYTQLGTEPRYLALFLPANLISGIGIGAAITALSSAAATSLPPERFAAGTGLVITARQLGGALGIAAMAAILTERQAQGADALLEVAIFCGIVGAVAAVSGLALTERRAGIRADADLPPAARVVERESSADRG